MRKIYYSILSAIVLLSATSCSWLDINSDPNKATSVEPEVLYNYAMASWAANRCSGDSYYPLGFAAQTLSTGGDQGWGNINVYDISPYSLGNTWKMYFASSGANLKDAIRLAEASVPVKNNIAAQCKINFAHLIFNGTMLYGDIPFSEAWTPAIVSPKFDSQKDILEGLIKILDEAIAQIDLSDKTVMTTYDLAYGGDLTKWIKYANSIKFRIAMVMVDKDPTKSTLIAQLLSEGKMIDSSAANYFFPFEKDGDRENPKFRMLKKYTNQKNLEFFANKLVVDPLKERKDPRLSKYFDKGAKATEYIGTGTNDEGVEDQSAMISLYLYRDVAPEYFFTYQEQLFLEAEAYARGLGVAKDLVKANTLYKKAMIAAMECYEADATSINDYVANNLVDLTKISDPVKEIHMQQWIDLMDRPLDAFTQWRRSGKEGAEVPALTVPRNAIPSKLMRRFTYSPDEASANPNTPDVDNLTDKVWFDE